MPSVTTAKRCSTVFTRVFGAVCFAVPMAMHAQSARGDSLAVVDVVSQFHIALAAGDSTRAVALLSNDVIVLESGASQTYAEYLGHHLGADMAAAKNARVERTVTRVMVIGTAAYLVARTMSKGTTTNAPGSESAEMMVLSKMPSGWRIRAIHWSSKRRRA